MNEMHLYEYAVIRYVPRVEREEFMNIGLVMMSKKAKWIKARLCINERRYSCFDNAMTIDRLADQCNGFVRIAHGDKSAGPIAELLPEERFRWITAMKSACIATSRPHPGRCENLEETFDRLFNELVK